MRHVLPTLITAICLSGPAAAEAFTPFWGPSEKQIYIADARMAGPIRHQSLCLRVTDTHRFFVPFRRTVGDYYFSKNQCATPDGHPLPTSRIPAFKEAGIIPDYVPDPPFAPLPMIKQKIMFLAIAALFAFGAYARVRNLSQTATGRMRRISGDPLFFDVLLTVMFHIARTDGAIERKELQAIIHNYKQLTGTTLSAETVAEKFAQVLKDDAVMRLAEGYRGEEAKLLLDGAILIATQHGPLTREKTALLTKLNEVLERDPSWFRQTIAAAKVQLTDPKTA